MSLPAEDRAYLEGRGHVTDYAAYFRLIRAQMLEVLAKGPDALLAESYPEPVEHCDVCRWWDRCNSQRRADDHLSFIAGVGRSAIREKEVGTGGRATQAIPPPGVRLQDALCGRVHRHVAGLAEFAVPNRQHAVAEVHIVAPEL